MLETLGGRNRPARASILTEIASIRPNAFFRKPAPTLRWLAPLAAHVASPHLSQPAEWMAAAWAGRKIESRRLEQHSAPCDWFMALVSVRSLCGSGAICQSSLPSLIQLPMSHRQGSCSSGDRARNESLARRNGPRSSSPAARGTGQKGDPVLVRRLARKQCHYCSRDLPAKHQRRNISRDAHHAQSREAERIPLEKTRELATPASAMHVMQHGSKP